MQIPELEGHSGRIPWTDLGSDVRQRLDDSYMRMLIF